MDNDFEGLKLFIEVVIMIKFEIFNIIIFESFVRIFCKIYDIFMCIYKKKKEEKIILNIK